MSAINLGWLSYMFCFVMCKRRTSNLLLFDEKEDAKRVEEE